MYERIKQEPALVTALVQGFLALCISFGLGLTPEQVGSILAVTAAIVAVVLRQRVSPAASSGGELEAGQTPSNSPELQPAEG